MTLPNERTRAIPLGPYCQCRKCLRERGDTVRIAGIDMPVEVTRMIVCPTCGNKRCPHASDHEYACTDSNESGQPGSVYQ